MAELAAVPAPRVALGRVVAAFLRRDLAQAASYRAVFVLRSLWLVAGLVAFWAFSRFLDEGGAALPFERYGRAGYVGFWLIGLSVGDLFESLAQVLSRRIRAAQVDGTLEATLSTPAPAAYVLIGSCATEILLAVFRLVGYLALGTVLFDVAWGPVSVPSLVLVSVLSLAAFVAVALVGGALTMFLRRTDPVSALVGLFAMIIGGVYFPVHVLPPVVARLSYAFPLTPALEGFRQALFLAAPPAALVPELAALGAFVAVVLPLSVWLFARALIRARSDGSLSQY